MQFIEIGTKQHHGREAEDGASGDDGSGSAVLAEAGGGGPGWPTTGDTVHIAYTSNGSPYTNYQVWVCRLSETVGCRWRQLAARDVCWRRRRRQRQQLLGSAGMRGRRREPRAAVQQQEGDRGDSSRRLLA